MSFIPALNTALCELRYSFLDSQMENTLYFQNDSAWDATSLDALGTAIINWWIANIKPEVSQQVIVHECFVTDLTTDEATALSVLPPDGAFGDLTTDPMPGNVTLAISFRTASRGRSARGRNYVVGLCEQSVDGNTVDPTSVTNLVAAYNALLAVASGLSVTWVVCSRRHNKANRANAVLFPITAATAVDGFVDSQRRRLEGRGR